jgi:hypothetical protein
MKKSLLFAAIAAGSLAFGQSNVTVHEAHGLNMRAKAELMKTEVNGVHQAPYLPGSRSAVVDMGQAANVYTVAFGRRDAVSVRPELNAITFIHRSNAGVNGDAGSGSLRYDHSLDGGATFTNNVGPVYNGGNARYPSAGMINDPSNTDIANSKFVYTAPILSGTNGGSWGGQLVGYVSLGAVDSVNTILESDDAAGDYNLISAGQWNSGQIMHHVDSEIDLITAGDYVDTIIYRRADFSGGGAPVLNVEELYVPVYNDTGIGKALVDSYIAFDPTGQTGYIAIIGHGGDVNVEPVGSYHLIVMKTTDGGNTWGAPVNVGVSSFADGQLLNDGSNYTCAFEGDIAVDSNGDMHFSVAVGPASGTWSIITTPGVWGIFDVHGDGTTFTGDLVGIPQTFRGDLGGLTEDSRPQVSASADGDFITVTWFDSDTLLVGSADNTFPDAWVRGYRVQDQTWLNEVNVSTGTAADAQCTWGTVGDLMFKNGDQATVAIVYASLVNADILSETQFHFLDGPYSFSGVGIEENDITEMRVFPNPASDMVRVAFEMKDATDVTVNVVNTVGQTVMTSAHSAITGGNVVTLNVANLANGLYFVEVNSANGTSTQRLIVQ